MTDSFFKRPELHIIQGDGNKVMEKLEDIDRKVDSLRLAKPLPVSDTSSQADSGVATYERELPKAETASLSEIPITGDIFIEAEKTVDTPASGVITEDEGRPFKEGGESVSNIIQFPIKKIELSFYQRVLRLFKNIIKCFKEF